MSSTQLNYIQTNTHNTRIKLRKEMKAEESKATLEALKWDLEIGTENEEEEKA